MRKMTSGRLGIFDGGDGVRDGQAGWCWNWPYVVETVRAAVRGADIKGFSSSADTLIAGEYSDEVEK